MKIKDLKEIIAHLPDNGQVGVEDKISGEKLPFDVLMGAYTNSSSITFYLR